MTTRCLLFAALALGLTSTAPAQEAGPLSDEDIAAIRAGHEAWVQVLLAGDWAAAAAWLTEDAVWMPPNNAVVRGRAAIEARLAEVGTITAFTATSVETDGRDGLAYDWVSYSITFRRVGMTEPITNTGKGLVVMRKQADGSWQANRVIWNSDLPLPEP